jgi:hypothetical protein
MNPTGCGPADGSAPAGRISRPGLSCWLRQRGSASRRFGIRQEDPVSRILSCAVIPLDAALPRTFISDLPGGFGPSLERPCGTGQAPSMSLAPNSCFPPYLVLLRVGFTLPPTLPPERCALAAPFHPYPGTEASKLAQGRPQPRGRGVAEAVSFLWH